MGLRDKISSAYVLLGVAAVFSDLYVGDSVGDGRNTINY
jgi:hypothetical protein